MRLLNNISIRGKQRLIMVFTSAVALLVVCASVIVFDAMNARLQHTKRVLSLAKVTAANCTAAVDFGDKPVALETLNSLRAEPEILVACVYDRDGHLFATFKRDDADVVIPQRPREGGQEVVGEQLFLFQPIVQQGEKIGTMFMVFNVSELSHRLKRHIWIVSVLFVSALMVALLVASSLQEVVSGPIVHLAEVARDIAANKNYSLRAQKQGRDEIGQLIDSFNDMLEQIHQRDVALEATRATLEQRVKDRTRELANSLALLKATLNSTVDGIIAVDYSGRIISHNERFATMWGLPPDLLKKGDYEAINFFAASRMKDPQRFLQRVDELRVHPVVESSDVLELADGRTFERVIYPQQVEQDCVGCVLSFRDITEHKKAEGELEAINYELRKITRQAGMAEVATSVLHNVGNVLNSVNTSTSVVMDHIRNSKVVGVARIFKLFEDNRADLAGFLSRDNRAEQIYGYLKTLSEHLTTERDSLLRELAELHKNVEHIKEVVAMQQSYAKMSGVEELFSVQALLEDALRMQMTALGRHQVHIERDYDPVPEILISKHKVLQIFVNLISNAKYALDEVAGERKLKLCIRNSEGRLRIGVTDNGMGISPENLPKIFSHGFTTRKSGHGFGLHSGLQAAKEMGGTLSVASDGPGKGATFTLELPLKLKKQQL